MHKLSASFILLTIISFNLIPCFAEEDSLSFATYYPAPYGVYNEMRVNSMVIGDAGASTITSPSRGALTFNPLLTDPAVYSEGTMYYSNAEHKFKYRDNNNWQSLGGSIPSKAVMFFNDTNCPSGWSELVQAKGRYVVGLDPNYPGSLGATKGSALTNEEDRTVGRHNHSFKLGGISNGPYTATNQGYASAGDPASGVDPRTSTVGLVDGTNAPYIQLLACQKD